MGEVGGWRVLWVFGCLWVVVECWVLFCLAAMRATRPRAAPPRRRGPGQGERGLCHKACPVLRTDMRDGLRALGWVHRWRVGDSATAACPWAHRPCSRAVTAREEGVGALSMPRSFKLWAAAREARTLTLKIVLVLSAPDKRQFGGCTQHT